MTRFITSFAVLVVVGQSETIHCMSSAITAHKHGRHRLPVTKILSIWVLCFCDAQAVQGVPRAAHKTNSELAQALIGTWELLSHRIGFSKIFLTYNADGTSKAIRLTDDRGSPRRAENDGTWRVTHGYLIRKVTNTTHDHGSPFTARVQIESIENGTAKFRYEKCGTDEMRRIDHLPSLPPLVTSKKWVSQLARAEMKAATISSPQPVYPLAARKQHWAGAGDFVCHIRPDGTVASVDVSRSTGHQVLDQAAITALQHWRFQPGKMGATLNVPIVFEMNGSRVRSRAIAPEGVL
jgi:TonB family protein